MSARRVRAMRHERLCQARVLNAQLAPCYVLEVELDGLPRMTNAQRGHWAARMKHAKMWKRRVFDAVWPHRPSEPLERAQLTLTRFSTKAPDFDGLVSGFKACVDALIHAGVLIDDNFSVIGQPAYLWERAQRGAGKVRVRVEAVG